MNTVEKEFDIIPHVDQATNGLGADENELLRSRNVIVKNRGDSTMSYIDRSAVSSNFNEPEYQRQS